MKVIENAIDGEIVQNEIQTVTLQYNGFGWDKVNAASVPSDGTMIKRMTKQINKEVPEGDVDGVNFIFKLQHIPLELSEHVYLNGVLQTRGEEFMYILHNNFIYFIKPPQVGSVIQCTYSAQGTVEYANEFPSGDTNGANDTFTARNVIQTGTEHVYLNGILQKEGPEYQYIIISNKIIFLKPPNPGAVVRIDYHS